MYDSFIAELQEAAGHAQRIGQQRHQRNTIRAQAKPKAAPAPDAIAAYETTFAKVLARCNGDRVKATKEMHNKHPRKTREFIGVVNARNDGLRIVAGMPGVKGSR